MKIVTLSNGKRIANFSSPHDFIYEDGTILPAVPNEEAKRLEVTFIEEEVGENGDVHLNFEISRDVWNEMNKWIDAAEKDLVDVVICPLPMITAIKQEYPGLIPNSPFRAIRMVSRIEKKASIHKQCI